MIHAIYALFLCCLLVAIAGGCSGFGGSAPVSSRATTPEPQPTVSKRGVPQQGAVPAEPAPGVTVRAARPVTQPLARPVGVGTPLPASSATRSSPAAAPVQARLTQHATHVVRRGDTLYSIAWQYDLEVQDLARLNAIREPYTIHPGQTLRLRGTGAGPEPSAPHPPAPRSPEPKPPVATVTGSAQPSPAGTTTAADRPGERPAASTVFDGRWMWPTRGRLLREFSNNTNGKKGIDISGHPGQPVRAAAAGKVVYVGSGLVGYGRLIIVKHNESLLSAYGHNSKLLVGEGDQVAAGQTIAKMGSSGATRTALYFEIRRDGKPVDPMKYLPAAH